MAKKESVTIETDVADAVATAFGVIQELADEMREAYDNTPESLQGSGVGEARGDAADLLEGISEPDVPECARDLPVKFEQIVSKKRQSRQSRLDDGLQYAYEAINAMEEKKNELAEDDGFAGEVAELEACINDVQEMIEEAEGVSFPGMYG